MILLDYLTQKSIGLIQRETVSRKRTRKIKSVVAEITFGDVAPLRILVVKVRVTVMDHLMEVKMMVMMDAKEILYVEGTIVKSLVPGFIKVMTAARNHQEPSSISNQRQITLRQVKDVWEEIFKE